MKLTAIVLALLALVLGAFGYWGTSTASGRRRFDEMAGIIPTAALALAGLLTVIAIVLFMIFFARSRP